MALITYTDKDNTSSEGSDERTWRHEDANEVKDVVNENADTIKVKAWNMSTNAFPTGGKNGQIYYGTELSTRTTLTDTGGNVFPSKVVAIAMQDSPTTNAHFMFMIPLF